MRTLLFASVAVLGMAAAPLAAHAAGVTPPSAAPAIVAAQSTTTPPFTVTAPPAINAPWHISTWRFHAGPNPSAPTQGVWGLSGGGTKEGGFQTGL